MPEHNLKIPQIASKGREMGPALGNSNLTPGGKSKPSVNREGKISINTNRKRSYSSVSASA